jgi:FixJ family two-component response regulator
VSCVFVIDDDPSIREALGSLFRSVDLKLQLFASTAEFLQYKRPDGPSCLVLDIRLPGMSGLDWAYETRELPSHRSRRSDTC